MYPTLAMGGHSVYVGVIRQPSAKSDAVTKLHELLVETIDLWIEVNIGSSVMRLRSDYFPEAVRYATQRGLWGPDSTGDRIEYFFTDFTGLESIGAQVFSHWYETALSLIHERMKPLLDELGVAIRVDVPPPDRLCTQTQTFPLVELGDFDTEMYWLEWPQSGRPAEGDHVLFSSDKLERRSLASLDPVARAEVERRALLRTCGCRSCESLRGWYWEGRDPWGRQYDFGWDEGVARFEAGDRHGCRASFLKGLLRGAPFAQEGFGIWIATTFALEGAPSEALQWLRYAVEDGYTDFDAIVADADFASLRGHGLEELVAAGPRRFDRLRAGRRFDAALAAESLAEPDMNGLARAVDRELGRSGPYPDPRPESLRRLVIALAARGARPAPSAVVALCERIGTGALELRAPEVGSAITLPAYLEVPWATAVAREHASPWTLPLRLLVLGEPSGPASGGLAERRLVRLDPASADVPPRLRNLLHAAMASGRDVQLDLLVCSLAEVAADLGTVPLRSATCARLVTDIADTLGAPVDACLALWEPAPGDGQTYELLSEILARGPTQLLGRMPAGRSSIDPRCVEAEPIAAGIALLAGGEGLPPDAAKTFTLSRLARHLAVHQRACAPSHRSRSELETELRSFLLSRGLGSARLRLDSDASGGCSSVDFELHDRELRHTIVGTFVLARRLDDERKRNAPGEKRRKWMEAETETLLEKAFTSLSGQESGWELRTIGPFPDHWPLTPDTRLSVYAFAQRDDDENPTLVHASAPFAEVSFDLGHDTLGVELTMLGDSIEELSLQGVEPLDADEVDRIAALPALSELLASAVEEPLDESALESIRARYAFQQCSSGVATEAIKSRHDELFDWLAAKEERRLI